MKAFFILLLFTALIFSCQKEEPLKNEYLHLPEWLQQQIREIENSDTDCFACSITRYTYQEKYYYNYYCSYSSCYMCNLRSEQGKLIEESDSLDFNDFLTTYTDETVVWSCE